jgi:very-short-patch-repair endonuclease
MPVWRQRNTARARELRNAASAAERALWRHLQGSQLDGYKFSRQMQIGPFFADFLCRQEKLIIELDGVSHDFTADGDARRTDYLEREGFRLIRFTNRDVFENADGVVALIRQALENRPTPGPSRKREGR